MFSGWGSFFIFETKKILEPRKNNNEFLALKDVKHLSRDFCAAVIVRSQNETGKPKNSVIFFPNSLRLFKPTPSNMFRHSTLCMFD